MINSMLSLLVLGFLFLNYKDRVFGIDYWIKSQIISISAFMVSVLRLVLPDAIAILVSNTLHFCAFLFLAEGLARYLGVKYSHRLNLILIGLGVAGLIVFTVNQPNLQARSLILHGVLFVLTLRMMFIFNRAARKITQRASIIMSMALTFNAIVALYNIGAALFAPVPDNYLEGNLYTIIGHTGLIILTVMVTYAEVLLVSDKLLHKVIASERKLNLVFDHSPAPLIVTHFNDGRIYNANASLLKMFEYSLSEIVGKTTVELNMWVDTKQRELLLSEVKAKGHLDDHEVVLRMRDGTQRICKLSALLIQLMEEKDQEDYLLVNISDVTQDVMTREDLKHLATHDHLTGLANRLLFYDRFDSGKARANRHQHHLAVIAIDLDHLKQVNDTYGHSVGDAILVHLAQQITGVLRKTDTFARFGGDEFCILLDEIQGVDDVEAVIAKILECVSIPMMHHEKPIPIAISIGIAMYPQDADTADALIDCADKALYTVKRNRQQPYAYFGKTPV
jgi:diguanylate cyclase (GGDEF)-like protein/PAS domain S-box-containing protein